MFSNGSKMEKSTRSIPLHLQISFHGNHQRKNHWQSTARRNISESIPGKQRKGIIKTFQAINVVIRLKSTKKCQTRINQWTMQTTAVKNEK